jgi:hypothetical protein
MARDERRVGVRQSFDEVNGIEHAFDRGAVGLIGERISAVTIKILDINHVCLAEAHDRMARSMGGHHRNEIDRLPVHVEGNRELTWRRGVVVVNRGRNAAHVWRRSRLAVGAKRRTASRCVVSYSFHASPFVRVDGISIVPILYLDTRF